MKQTATELGIVFLFMCMLIQPNTVFTGAASGLLLWFQIILPTLFPFLLISNLLLVTGSIHFITDALGGLFVRLFRVSPPGSFCVLVGFLCGYPMGAKTTADMVKSGLITPEEGKYLLSFCNNTSPSFIVNYLVLKTLHSEKLVIPTLVILFLTPVCISFVTRKYSKQSARLFLRTPGNIEHTSYCNFRKSPALGKHSSDTTQATHNMSGFLRNFDTCITDSADTLVKVGGYIILFSVLLTLLQKIPLDTCWFTCLLSAMEITNGITILGNSGFSFPIRYALLLGLTAFGGVCSIAQTQCMIQPAHLPLLPYIIEKLAAAVTASLLGILYLALT